MKKKSQPVARCVFCGCRLTAAPSKRWWIHGARHGQGLCYDCIMSGMRIIMASVERAQRQGEEIKPA